MLTSFGADMELFVRKLFLGLTGGAVSIFVLTLAILIIVNSYKKSK